MEHCSELLERPMEVGNDEYEATALRDALHGGFESLVASPSGLPLPQHGRHDGSRPAAHQRWHEQISALRGIEGEHPDRVADASGAATERFDEVRSDMQLGL